MEGLMLKLKLQYFGYLMRRTDSLQKTLMLKNTEVRKKQVLSQKTRVHQVKQFQMIFRHKIL